MVKIFRSDLCIGNTVFVERDPYVLELFDHVYCPSGTTNCATGVYDVGRKLVQQSAYSRGPVPSEVMPSGSLPFDYRSVEQYADDDTYVFLGELHDHYGHFLLSTLSRLWQIKSLSTNYKIVINAGAALRMRLDHVERLLAAFGVSVERFWAPERPIRFRKILMPCPAFEERNFVHAVFAGAFRSAGDSLVRGAHIDISGDGPIYLSKSKNTTGVRKIVNEELIEQRLVKEGYAVVYPEMMPIEEQIALWRLGRPIVGFNGSSLHTSAFASSAQIISLGWDRHLDTSFLLCDRATGNKGDYFYFEPGTLEELGPSLDFSNGQSGFSSRLEVRNPEGAAEGIMRAVDVSLRRSSGNIALGKPTAQSSRYIESNYDASNLSATSGKLTGSYQFCTCCEVDPWWQVDLGKVVEIARVNIYNRTDSAPERSNNIKVLVSQDGVSFELVAEREDVEAFGGLNGKPYDVTLVHPRRGRYMRIAIPGPEFLHLDQVEVFETVKK